MKATEHRQGKGAKKQNKRRDKWVKRVGRTAVSESFRPNLVRHQRQIGHRRGHYQLEQRLDPPDVPRLPHPQLHQTSQPMPCRLPLLPVVPERVTLLQCPRLLQQRLLRMKAHRAPFARSRLHTRGTLRADSADRWNEREPEQLLSRAVAICPLSNGYQSLTLHTGRTDTGLG